jgi:hypothetical protein
MLTIDTYLRIDGRFVPIGSFVGSIPDPDYVEGAIVIKYDGFELMGLQHWDYVDQLWAYIVDAILEVADGKSFECHFPDQPISMKFKSADSSLVEISVDVQGGKSISLERQIFLRGFSSAASDFFASMKRILPQASATWDDYAERLRTLFP